MNEQERQEKIKVVKDYWNEQGKKYGADPLATIKDHQFRLLEMDFIRDLLKHNDIELSLKNKFTLLDVLTCLFDEMSASVQDGSVIDAS